MKATMLMLIVMGISTPFQQTRCQCEKVRTNESTNWGWQKVVLRGEKRVKRIQGRVLDPLGSPLSEVLVEVFDHPEALLMKPSPERDAKEEKQNRIAVCKTGKGGKFCFTGIPPGRYELRCSKRGFDAPQMIVILDPKSRRSSNKKLIVILPASQ